MSGLCSVFLDIYVVNYCFLRSPVCLVFACCLIKLCCTQILPQLLFLAATIVDVARCDSGVCCKQ